MKRLSLLTAAVLLAAGAHAQTTPPTTPLPPSVGANPTLPADVAPGSVAAQPPAGDATSTSGTGSAAQEVKNERQAARPGGEMSTPQQDRGGYSGLGDESPVPMR